MKDILNIEVKITDTNKTYLLKIDTIKNLADIYGEYDTDDFDYHFETQSILLIKLVDELGGIRVDDSKIDGKKALELTSQGKFIKVVKAIVKAIENRNLFMTITSLFRKLKKYIKTDLSFGDLVRLILSETIDLDKWKLEIH